MQNGFDLSFYNPHGLSNALPLCKGRDWTVAAVHRKTAAVVIWRRGMDRLVGTTKG